MTVMLAHEVMNPGTALLLIFFALAAPVLALAALVPAWRGNRPLTRCLVLTSTVFIGLVVIFFGASFLPLGEQKFNFWELLSLMALPFMFLAVLPASLNLLALWTLRDRERRLRIPGMPPASSAQRD